MKDVRQNFPFSINLATVARVVLPCHQDLLDEITTGTAYLTLDFFFTCDEPGEQEAAKQAVTDAGEDPRAVLLLLPLPVPALGKLTEDPEHIVDDSHGPGNYQIDRDEPLQGTLVPVKSTCNDFICSTGFFNKMCIAYNRFLEI